MSIPLPDAYEHGWIPFLGAHIQLDSRPLIPRSETEWWTEKAIEAIKQHPGARVLDIFAGSGCVGCAVLLHVANVHVDFAELDAQHLATVRKNIVRLGPLSTPSFYISDVYEGLPPDERYDFILANPPYLSDTRRERVEPTVLAHEPHQALFADDDGFALIHRTIAGAPERLLPNGQLWIEHEPEHTERIKTTATSIGLEASTHRDQYGVERYSVIIKR
ncbi:MAG: peptide chain release factor N(5)-glutamine methyltransferase [Candidatus Parcubacteria bacterium]|jgi:HemK-like putative methylase